MRLELSLIDMAVVFGAPCICRGALQSLTNATILPHLLSGLPHWSATKSNSWNAFDLEISILLPNSQASFLTIGIHPKYFTLMCSQNILETNCLGMLYTYLAIKEAQILKYLLWYFTKLTGFFKIQYFKGHTPDWVLPKSLNADNSGQLYWLWQNKLKPGRQVSQCLMKSMICKRSETIMTIL